MGARRPRRRARTRGGRPCRAAPTSPRRRPATRPRVRGGRCRTPSTPTPSSAARPTNNPAPGRPARTTGWQAGTYNIFVHYDAPGDCLDSQASSAVTVDSGTPTHIVTFDPLPPSGLRGGSVDVGVNVSDAFGGSIQVTLG